MRPNSFYFYFGVAVLAIPSHFLDRKNGLKMICNGLKIIWKNDVRMVWLCKFRGGMNGWDLKILYRDLKSWKKMIWNEIVWKIRKIEKIE